MDLATVLGLIIGFGLVIGAIMTGGAIEAFVDVPSVLIVIFGTFSITTVCFTLKEIISGQGLWLKSILFKLPDAVEESKYMLELAQKARANGLLSIQTDVDSMSDEFVKQGFNFAVDFILRDFFW